MLAMTFAVLFTIIRYVGAPYLLYLAWKFWTAPARPMGASDVTPESSARLFLGGLSIVPGSDLQISGPATGSIPTNEG